MGKAMLTVMSAFAQLECNQLVELARVGVVAVTAKRRRAGRREVIAGHWKVKRVRELKAQGLKPADFGRIIGAGRVTVYRHLGMDAD